MPRDAFVVAPFYRASVALGLDERGLFARGLDDRGFRAAMRATPSILRQNARRLFAAAHLAAAIDAPLVLVEGWRSNTIVRTRGRRARVVSGSWIFATFLRLLQRRGLVPTGIRV